jgi:hypothetical protein
MPAIALSKTAWTVIALGLVSVGIRRFLVAHRYPRQRLAFDGAQHLVHGFLGRADEGVHPSW